MRDELNATITRREVTDKLNQTFSIDAGFDHFGSIIPGCTILTARLSSDVLSDINRTITKSMLSQEVLDELNASNGPSKLSSEVSNALKPVVVGQPSSVVGVR